MALPEETASTTRVRPAWQADLLREHLRFFNGADVDGRATGTSGFATAASYIAARMDEFGLQPALGSNAQTVYPLAINEMRGASLTSIASDTLLFYPGTDYLPDGRSDSGRVEIGTLTLESATPAAGRREAPSTAVLLSSQQASTPYLTQLRDVGVAVVLVMGPLTPRPAPVPIRGLLIVQVLPQTVYRVLETTRGGLAASLRQGGRITLDLPRLLRLRIDTQALTQSGALNILGYTPGKHPVRTRELVLVCADLDDIGTFAGVPTVDTDHLGAGAAALLEVAREYALFAQFGSVPERTLLFAVFSGAHQGHAGLKAYLQHPVWSLNDTRAVLYLGLDPASEREVGDLLDGHDLPLYAVRPAADTAHTHRVVLIPPRRPPRRRTLLLDEEPVRSTPPRLAERIEDGVLQAHAMADSAHTLLLREAVTGAPLLPVEAKPLRVPKANGR